MKNINRQIILLWIMTAFCTLLTSCGKGTEMNMIKSETTHDAVTISDISLSKSPEGIILEAVWNNQSESIVQYGRKFLLEVKNGDIWEKAPMVDGAMFTLEELMVYPSSLVSDFNSSNIKFDNKGANIRMNISDYYKVESDNKYRAIIEFREANHKDIQHQAVVYFDT